MKHEVLLDDLRFPEGPAFADDGALWCVELLGGTLVRFADGMATRKIVGGRPNGIAIRENHLFFCDAEAHAVRCFDLAMRATDDVRVIADRTREPALDAPNDLAFDASGNLVFTCPGNSRAEPSGAVWCLHASGTLHSVRTGMYFPNGLAFTPDGTSLIVAETYRHRLWRGGWDAHRGRWIDPHVWVEVGGPIGPDGMAFAPDGQLYVAIYGQGRVKVIDQQGQVAEEIAIPGANPTNVAFDPKGTLGFVVTEAEHGRLLSFAGVGESAR